MIGRIVEVQDAQNAVRGEVVAVSTPVGRHDPFRLLVVLTDGKLRDYAADRCVVVAPEKKPYERPAPTSMPGGGVPFDP